MPHPWGLVLLYRPPAVSPYWPHVGVVGHVIDRYIVCSYSLLIYLLKLVLRGATQILPGSSGNKSTLGGMNDPAKIFNHIEAAYPVTIAREYWGEGGVT